MQLIVTAHELRYGGKTLLRNARFEAPEKHAVALKMLRKAADAPPDTPLRQAATVAPRRPAPAPAVEPPPELALEPTPEPAAAPEPESIPEPAPEAPPAAAPEAPRPAPRYRNRRLRSED